MRPPVCQRDLRDDDLAAHGCVIASLAWVRREAGGEPISEAGMRSLLRASGASLREFRERGIMLGEAQTAQSVAYASGLRTPPLSRRVLGGTVRADLLPDIEAGAWALVWVDYAIVQDAGRGVGTFRGRHGVVYASVAGTRMTVIDPLRRQVTEWPLDLAIRAAEGFGSKRRLNALVVRRSPTWEQEAGRLRGLASTRTAQRDTARARVAELEAGGGPGAEALAAARAGGIADAAANAAATR